MVTRRRSRTTRNKSILTPRKMAHATIKYLGKRGGALSKFLGIFRARSIMQYVRTKNALRLWITQQRR